MLILKEVVLGYLCKIIISKNVGVICVLIEKEKKRSFMK